VVFSTDKTDCHDITEILLKVMLNTITRNPSKTSNNYGILGCRSRVTLQKHPITMVFWAAEVETIVIYMYNVRSFNKSQYYVLLPA
jgi:hypothetical protein